MGHYICPRHGKVTKTYKLTQRQNGLEIIITLCQKCSRMCYQDGNGAGESSAFEEMLADGFDAENDSWEG